ncbi:hypothetical protein H7F51_02075 [Novosphingobium flavum]|uniref:Uncharacterized protein n=1 Tax=Novosphingobium flavum TaxID=1778672 RepID=A0A7X1FNY1_9SPHN|nr:hypothetical protein [Novosphingobium flavum]MBC2664300.1 hypothetical protein [Novosphingobium flavum]
MREDSDAEPITDLIQGLLLEAGRLMEDESVPLALAFPGESAPIAARIARLHQVATDLLTLATAAQTLASRLGARSDPV